MTKTEQLVVSSNIKEAKLELHKTNRKIETRFRLKLDNQINYQQNKSLINELHITLG